jgi:hypothetical protein
MQSSKISEWLSLIANVGVVIGIFALIAELNHASGLAEVEAYQTRTRDIQELNLQLALSDSLADILEKAQAEGVETLTPGEYRRARAWYGAILRGMQGQYYQYQHGFLERESVDRTLDDIAGGIFENWEQFRILDSIEIQEWRVEIDQRMLQAGET